MTHAFFLCAGLAACALIAAAVIHSQLPALLRLARRFAPALRALQSALRALALLANPRSARGAHYRAFALTLLAAPRRIARQPMDSVNRRLLRFSFLGAFCIAASLCAYSVLSPEPDAVAIPFASGDRTQSPCYRTELATLNQGHPAHRSNWSSQTVALFKSAALWIDLTEAAQAAGSARFAIARADFLAARANAQAVISIRKRSAPALASGRSLILQTSSFDFHNELACSFDPGLFITQTTLAAPFQWSLPSALASWANPFSPSFLNDKAASLEGLSSSAPLAPETLQAAAVYGELTLQHWARERMADLILLLGPFLLLLTIWIAHAFLKSLLLIPREWIALLRSPAQLAKWEAAILIDSRLPSAAKPSTAKGRL